MKIPIEIGAGELLDKISILRIKSDRITDASKLQNVRTELEALERRAREHLPADPLVDNLATELRAVNEKLWIVEDDLRDCERDKDFGGRFVELARSVYHINDERARIKRRLDQHLGSAFVEEKSYQQY